MFCSRSAVLLLICAFGYCPGIQGATEPLPVGFGGVRLLSLTSSAASKLGFVSGTNSVGYVCPSGGEVDMMLPVGDVSVYRASVELGQVVVSNGLHYVCQVSDEGYTWLVVPDSDEVSTRWFWLGFSTFTIFGLVGLSAVWVKRVMVGGNGLNE